MMVLKRRLRLKEEERKRRRRDGEAKRSQQIPNTCYVSRLSHLTKLGDTINDDGSHLDRRESGL